MRSFMLRLLMVLRFQPVPFVFGLVMAGFGITGLATFVPAPADSPFDYVLPMQPLFWVNVLLGVGFVWYAWRKTPK